MHYCRYPRTLQFEISSNCNAACLYCQRQTDTAGLPPKNQFLPFELFQNVIDSEAAKELKIVEFNGTVDDPLMRPDLLDFIDFSIHRGKKISLHTNASIRTPEYWARLGKRFSKYRQWNGVVKFNVDGLADTNHIYRVNTRFDKIMENAQAFLDAGGIGYWQFIEFEWNSHQIEEARELAKKMGFERFNVRRSKPMSKDIVPTKEISCYYGRQKMYLIKYDGSVLPCCFYSTRHTAYPFFEGAWNNLHNNSFDDIINHKFYAEELTRQHTSLERCVKNCGKRGTINSRLNENNQVYDSYEL